MIQAAMLFALGAFASALFCLAFFTVLARRIRRVTEQRLKASLATKRADFDTERDEMRARNAIEINRLEREAGALRDRVTAHRLDADLKAQEIAAFMADLAAREDELAELRDRQAELQESLVEAKRRLAETGTALRAGHQALEAEMQRRLAMQDEISRLRQTAEDRRVELVGRQAEIEYLRSLLSAEESGEGREDTAGRVAETAAASREQAPLAEAGESANGHARDHSSDQSGEGGPGVQEIARIAENIKRMANDKDLAAFIGDAGRRREERAPASNGPARQAEARKAPRGSSGGEHRSGRLGAAEARFFKALDEIRSLKDETKTPAE